MGMQHEIFKPFPHRGYAKGDNQCKLLAFCSLRFIVVNTSSEKPGGSPHPGLLLPLGEGMANSCFWFAILLRQIQSREYSRGRRTIHPLLGGTGRGRSSQMANSNANCEEVSALAPFVGGMICALWDRAKKYFATLVCAEKITSAVCLLLYHRTINK